MKRPKLLAGFSIGLLLASGCQQMAGTSDSYRAAQAAKDRADALKKLEAFPRLMNGEDYDRQVANVRGSDPFENRPAPSYVPPRRLNEESFRAEQY